LKDDCQDQSIQSLWNDFCRYLYLPRLADSDVLKDTIEAGITTQDFFGYASGKENDRYLGLIFGKSGTVYVDDKSIIIRKEAARKQLDAEMKTDLPSSSAVSEHPSDWRDGATDSEDGASTDDPRPPDHPTDPVPSKKLPTRFHGSVNLDPVGAALEFSTITQEILQHFSSKIGAKVTITVEIEAKCDNGFDDSTCRTVKENSNTLGFNIAEFEDE